MSKQSVLILGAQGSTGSSIVDGLLSDGDFDIIAAVRPSSASKPSVEALKARGVEIRILDLEHATPGELDAAVKDIDIVISTVNYDQIENQRSLIDASKRVGVKRFIPSDWATPCVPGVRKLHDDKLNIRDYAKKAGINYTFIDVGLWFLAAVPIVDSTKSIYRGNAQLEESSRRIYGTGDVKNAVTDLHDVGLFVARILKDDRTLNKYIFCWSQELTQKEVFEIADRTYGQTIPRSHWGAEELIQSMEEAQGVVKHILEYQVSFYIRGDNLVENARKEEYGGALDARELYPDIKLRSLEDWAGEYYKSN